MKKIFIITAVVCISSGYLLAGEKISMATSADKSDKAGLSSLLTLYYDIKNALVSDNAETAAKKAAEFVKAINAIDRKAMSKDEDKIFTPLQPKLLFDATHISETKEIAHQREHFTNFSANMVTLAKAVKLTPAVVYEQYCPMKKAYWLSNDSTIRNPYYGSSMLTCGRVAEKIK
jgi:Protein of unknown function (DUF3347)